MNEKDKIKKKNNEQTTQRTAIPNDWRFEQTENVSNAFDVIISRLQLICL